MVPGKETTSCQKLESAIKTNNLREKSEIILTFKPPKKVYCASTGGFYCAEECYNYPISMATGWQRTAFFHKNFSEITIFAV